MSLFRIDPKKPFEGPHQNRQVVKRGPTPEDADGTNTRFPGMQ